MREGEGVVQVSSNDTSSETVVGVVSSLNHFVHVGEFHEGHHGSENFFLGDSHIVSNVSEDGGLNVESLVSESISSGKKFSSISLSTGDVSKNLIHLGAVNLGALLDTFLELRSKLEGRGIGSGLLNEFIVDLLVNESAGSSAAALSGVEEEREVSLLDGEVNVGIVHDDVGGLTTELEGDSLEVMGVRVAHDVVSDFSRSGEGNLVNIGVLGEVRSARSLTGEDVDNTFRESSLDGELSHLEGGERSLLSNLGDGNTSSSEGGSPFPGSHEGGEVPGDDLSANTDSLESVVLEVGTVNGDNISEVLISPASVGSELADD